MKIPGAYPLFEIEAGRLFLRDLSDGLQGFVGVLDLPREVVPEHFTVARVSDRLRLAATTDCQGEPFAHRSGWPETVAESDVNALLLNMPFRRTELADAFEMGVRASHLQHPDQDRHWCIVFGGIDKGVPALGREGLYEFTSEGVEFVSDDPHTGINLGQVLREPIWGPAGRYGLATSMDPSAYASWVEGNRKRNAASDPLFARCLQRLREDGHQELLVYTLQERQEQDRQLRAILRAFMAGDEAVSTLAAAPRPKA